MGDPARWFFTLHHLCSVQHLLQTSFFKGKDMHPPNVNGLELQHCFVISASSDEDEKDSYQHLLELAFREAKKSKVPILFEVWKPIKQTDQNLRLPFLPAEAALG